MTKNENVCTVYRSVLGVDISIKMIHIRKFGGKTFRGFCHDFGDVPIVTCVDNEIYEVVNHRGLAYANRNSKCYRNKKVYSRKHLKVSFDF